MSAAALRLERRSQADASPVIRGAVMMTPPINADYWAYRVVLPPVGRRSVRQAVLGSPKFATIGVGFALEDDWNTNLPFDCLPQRIVAHIWHNRGPADGLDPGVVVHAVEMIQWAAFIDRDGFRTPYVGDHTPAAAQASGLIDLEDADGMDPGPQRDALIESAARWQAQAKRQTAGVERSEKIHRHIVPRLDLATATVVRPCRGCPNDIDGYPPGAYLCVVCEHYAALEETS